jgi:hypothetical protein
VALIADLPAKFNNKRGVSASRTLQAGAPL